MWWSRPLASLVLLLGLAGCGFQPMYGTSSANPATVAEMASIQIKPMPERSGQLLYNALMTRLNPKGEPSKPRYQLSVVLTIAEGQVALRKDDTATRDVQAYTANYILSQNGVQVAAGVVTQTLSYDFLEQHYANVSAAEDIRRRAAEVLADELRGHLAAYFIRKAEAGAGQTGVKP